MVCESCAVDRGFHGSVFPFHEQGLQKNTSNSCVESVGRERLCQGQTKATNSSFQLIVRAHELVK